MGGPAHIWWNTHYPSYLSPFFGQPSPRPPDLVEPDFLSWFQPSLATSDYFNLYADPNVEDQYKVTVPYNRDGHQWPAELDGEGYAGIIISFKNNLSRENYREYLECKLLQPLLVNHTYNISFKVSLGHDMVGGTAHTIKSIKPFFTNSFFQWFTHYEPDISNGEFPQEWSNFRLDIDGDGPNNDEDGHHWMSVEGTYTVTGSNKNYVTIGNFQNIQQINEDVYPYVGEGSEAKMYYFIDNVQITDVPPVQGSCNCKGYNTISIQPYSNFENTTQCCYDFYISSQNLMCWYNKIIIKNIRDPNEPPYEFVNNGPEGFPRDGMIRKINTLPICVTIPDNFQKATFDIEIWGKAQMENR